MGRKRKELTPAELEERKQRWWGEERNARRRLRYREDAEYRALTIQQVRLSYHEKCARTSKKGRISSQPVRSDLLKQIGQKRLLQGGKQNFVFTFTIEEVASVLERDAQVIYRWLKSGLLPSPECRALNERNRWQNVYTLGEILCMRDVLACHFQRSVYFKAHHTDTQERLSRAFAAERGNFSHQRDTTPS